LLAGEINSRNFYLQRKKRQTISYDKQALRLTHQYAAPQQRRSGGKPDRPRGDRSV
jgi:hypothetical protein